MGVHEFFKVFPLAGRPIAKLNEVLMGKRVAIDMHGILYKTIKAVHATGALTDASGIPTAGLVNLLSLLPKLKAAGAMRIIAVFDNPEANPMKMDECERRRSRAKECKERAENAEDDDEQRRLEAAAWQMTAAVIADAQYFLTLAGIEFHVAPIGREAEQHAADLVKAGVIDIAISDDSDALMFGATDVLTARPSSVGGKRYKYMLFNLPALLAGYGLTLAEFRHVCISLGTDFAHKTPNVGPATAITRGKNKALSAEQERALAYVASTPERMAEITVAKPPNIAVLTDWLVDNKGFNHDRVRRALASYA
jgi:5'-3' exonuclease